MSEQQKNRWWQSMIAVHGSEEAVRQFMRLAQKKSMERPRKPGGFATIDPKLARQIQSKGGKASKRTKKIV